jgi:hypothetical protein
LHDTTLGKASLDRGAAFLAWAMRKPGLGSSGHLRASTIPLVARLVDRPSVSRHEVV